MSKLDEAMEALREYHAKGDVVPHRLVELSGLALAAYDAERAAKVPTIYVAAKQCEINCGARFGSSMGGRWWCSPLCHACGRPVNPKVRP